MNVSILLVINTARRSFWSTQCIATCRSCGVHTFMSTMTPRSRAVGRGGFQRRWVVFFRHAPLRPRAPPRLRLHPAADLARASPHMASVLRKPAVNELAMSITDDLTVAGAWIGKGELNFPEVNGEELHALAPNRIESGFRYSLSYSVSDLKILEDRGS